MNFKTLFLGLAALILVGACGENGSIHDGAQARFTAKAVSNSGHDSHEHDDGGDNHAKHTAEYITFRTAEGVRIDLQLGLVNVVPVEMKACASVTALLKQAGDFMLGSAWAHAGSHEDDEPTNYLDALSHDAVYVGALPLETDRYCGVVVALEPVVAMDEHERKLLTKHGEVDNGLSDHAANVAPCYFLHTAELTDEEYAAGDYDTTHSCIQFQVGSEAATLELDFPEPVTVTAEQHHVLVELAAYHETWFDGVVMDDVQSVEAEQAKLMANIQASIYIETVSFE